MLSKKVKKYWNKRYPKRPSLADTHSANSILARYFRSFVGISLGTPSAGASEATQSLLERHNSESAMSQEEAGDNNVPGNHWGVRPTIKDKHQNSFLQDSEAVANERSNRAMAMLSPASGSGSEDDRDLSDEEAVDLNDLESNPRELLVEHRGRYSNASGKTVSSGFFASRTKTPTAPSSTGSPSSNPSRTTSFGSNGTHTSNSSSEHNTLSWTNFAVSHALKKRLKAERSRLSFVHELQDRLTWTFTRPPLLVWCAVWALAITAVHFVGMESVTIEAGYIEWNFYVAIVTYLLAFVNCLVFTCFLFWGDQRVARHLVFGLVAATGLCAMHYIGTAAAQFHSWSPVDDDQSNTPMFIVVSIATFSVGTCFLSNFLLAHVTASSRDRIIETVMTKRRLWRVMAQKEAAEAANILKSDFISVASHEIRTPLHTVSGYTDLLGRTELSEEQLLYLSNIRRAVHTIQLITRQVLDFSRMERHQGELEAKPSNVNIRDMVQGLASMPEERSAEARHVALNVFVHPDCPETVFVDETYLTRVLMNLLSNALKFTVKGHVLLRVTLAPKPNELLFEIQDTGIGIPEKFQATLFDPFTQADQSLTRKPNVGFGLGLAIAKQLTNRLHGRLSVRSAEKKGTTFSLCIPCLLPSSAEEEMPLGGAEQTPLSPSPSTRSDPFLSVPPVLSPARESIKIKVCGKHTFTRKSTVEIFSCFGFDASEWTGLDGQEGAGVCSQADYVWFDPEWASTNPVIVAAVLKHDPLPATGSDKSSFKMKPIACVAFNSPDDLTDVPLLLSATNVLRLQRPIIFHQIAIILDRPLPFLSSTQRDHQPFKTVRFAASIHSAASTPASEADHRDAYTAERQSERRAFAQALEAQDAVSGPEQEFLPRMKKVLLVEDNPINQRLGCKVLQKLNYETSLAKNGREAVELVKSDVPDIVLMDLSMPVMNGLDATREIRRIEAEARLGRRTPIIALTANANQESEDECKKAGMDGFLTKPLLMDELSAMLTKWTNVAM